MYARHRWLVAATAAALLVAAAVLLPDPAPRVAYARESARASAARDRIARVEDLSTAFEEVAKVIRPSVVNISSIKKVVSNQTIRRFPDALSRGPFRDFFGDDFFDHFFNAPDRSPHGYVQQGLGTGVIVSDDGYILTNNHVVDAADEVSVKLSDERTFRAKVIGTDPKTDLAVIKIDADDVHPAELGDSDALRVGEWVVAAGNPFGLSATITSGIVSAKGRANVGIADYEDFIQTDAAINPGNSGGPLLNLRGEVVGINTAIFTRSGGYMGIGFSIPINMARRVMDSLIEKGHVVRGWLGVLIQNLDPDMAASFGYDGTDGALVGDVTSGSPGDRAGLKPGDIILSVDGKTIKNITQLRSMVAGIAPGTKAQLEVFRDGRRKTLYVEIGELEGEVATAQPRHAAIENMGMTVRTLTPDVAAQLGYDEDLHGVVITNVEPFGMAQRAGLRERDVIVKVQGTPIASLAQFRSEMAGHDLKKGVRLRVRSGTTERFAFLRAQE